MSQLFEIVLQLLVLLISKIVILDVHLSSYYNYF